MQKHKKSHTCRAWQKSIILQRKQMVDLCSNQQEEYSPGILQLIDVITCVNTITNNNNRVSPRTLSICGWCDWLLIALRVVTLRPKQIAPHSFLNPRDHDHTRFHLAMLQVSIWFPNHSGSDHWHCPIRNYWQLWLGKFHHQNCPNSFERRLPRWLCVTNHLVSQVMNPYLSANMFWSLLISPQHTNTFFTVNLGVTAP